jgi:hypothetical protein
MKQVSIKLYDYGGEVDTVYGYKPKGPMFQILVVIFLVYTIITMGLVRGWRGRPPKTDQNKAAVSDEHRSKMCRQ